jgi:ketosteroid isomerase-like protein
MRTRAILSAALALTLPGTACQPPAPEAVSLSDADKDAIRAVIEANVDAGIAADWDTFLSHFADDAVIMWPNLPAVVGLEAIRAVEWSRAVESEISPIDIVGVGDLAYVRGTYSLLLDFEGAVREEGKYVNVLRKQPDGSWRFTVWMNNSDLPLPEAESGT